MRYALIVTLLCAGLPVGAENKNRVPFECADEMARVWALVVTLEQEADNAKDLRVTDEVPNDQRYALNEMRRDMGRLGVSPWRRYAEMISDACRSAE